MSAAAVVEIGQACPALVLAQKRTVADRTTASGVDTTFLGEPPACHQPFGNSEQFLQPFFDQEPLGRA